MHLPLLLQTPGKLRRKPQSLKREMVFGQWQHFGGTVQSGKILNLVKLMVIKQGQGELTRLSS